MATLEQLQTALVNADKAGDEQAAKSLAQAIIQMQQQPAQQDDLSLARDFLSAPTRAADYFKGIRDFAAQMAIDPVSKVASGGAGIGDLLRGEGAEQAAESVRQMQQQTTPELSDQGQMVSSDIQQAINTISEIPGIDSLIQGASSISELAPEIGRRTAAMLADPLGLIGMSDNEELKQFKQQVENVGSALGEAAPETATIAAGMVAPLRVKPGDLSKSLAQKTFQPSEPGKAPDFERQVNTKGIKEAVRQGFDEGVVNAIESSGRTDKQKMSAMLGSYKKVRANPKLSERPSDIAGDSVLERFRVVKKANLDAGKDIDRAANLELKGKQVDASEAVDNFVQDLIDLGVDFDANSNPIFKQSDVVGGKEAIKNIINRLKSVKTRDGLNLHKLKRFIDNNVSYGKTQTGLDAKVERVLKDLRKSVNDSLINVSDDYATANQKYSETIGVIDELQSIAGKRIDLTGANADKAVGTLLRRLMGNAQSRVALSNALENMESVAAKNGGKFSDDIRSQVLFADVLDSSFGPTARTGLESTIRRSVGDVPLTKGGLIQEGLERVIDKARNVNEDAAFKALEELLK